MELSQAELLHREYSSNFGSTDVDLTGTSECIECAGSGMIQRGDGWTEPRYDDSCPNCLGWGYNYRRGDPREHGFERDPDTYQSCKHAAIEREDHNG